jgi:hypothetical protein
MSGTAKQSTLLRRARAPQLWKYNLAGNSKLIAVGTHTHFKAAESIPVSAWCLVFHKIYPVFHGRAVTIRICTCTSNTVIRNFIGTAFGHNLISFDSWAIFLNAVIAFGRIIAGLHLKFVIVEMPLFIVFYVEEAKDWYFCTATKKGYLSTFMSLM